MSSLVLLGTKEHTQQLGKLLRYYSDVVVGKITEDELHASPEVAEVSELVVENKYFTAQLNVHLLSEKSPVSGINGLLFIADSVADLSADQYAFAKELAEEDIPLRMLIKFEESADSFDDFPTYLDWALDNGFEVVTINESGLFRDISAREKEGLPRVWEAIQSTQWDGAEMKETVTSTSRVVTSTPIANNESVVSCDDPTYDTLPTTEMIPESEPVENNNMFTSLMEGISDMANVSEDDLFDRMTRIMGEARQARDMAMAGNVSDAERRRRAELLATKLMAMLGDDEDEDDEDE